MIHIRLKEMLMSTIDFDSIGPEIIDEITVDSFVDTMKLQLDAFKDIVHSGNKTGTLSYDDWLQQFAEFIEYQD